MRIYDESKNDGTIAITTEVDVPIQGTFVGDDGATLAKGMVRPPLAAQDLSWFEETGHVRQAAFGRTLGGSGTLYRIRETGREACRLDRNTVLFNAARPHELIEEDNRRLAALTARDLVPPERLALADAGIPLGLLIEPMAPWRMLGSIPWPGTRATAYGVEDIGEAEETFWLLPGSAEELLRKVRRRLPPKPRGEGRWEVEDLIGKGFVVHRHPALPDASSSYYAVLRGIAMWAAPCDADYGVIIPADSPAWRAAGGDFDGDSASVLLPFDLRGQVARQPLKTSGSSFRSADIEGQMLEAAGDSVTSLLGPVIISATRAFERGIEDDAFRSDAASAAQASVEAKKHPVDEASTRALASFVFEAVRTEKMASGIDFIADMAKAIDNAPGEAEKAEAWVALARMAGSGVWDRGSRIEAAMVERIGILDGLFRDSGYLRACIRNRAELPKSLRKRAQELAPLCAVLYVEDLNREMERLLADRSLLRDEPDEDNREGRDALLAEGIRNVRRRYRVACVTGAGICEPREMQLAVLGYAPARTAATAVTAEVVRELRLLSKEIIVNLFGHHWQDGTYKVADLVPINHHAAEVEALGEIADTVVLSVIHRTPGARSVRVHLAVLGSVE